MAEGGRGRPASVESELGRRGHCGMCGLDHGVPYTVAYVERLEAVAEAARQHRECVHRRLAFAGVEGDARWGEAVDGAKAAATDLDAALTALDEEPQS